jgi:hypothetical protein
MPRNRHFLPIRFKEIAVIDQLVEMQVEEIMNGFAAEMRKTVIIKPEWYY